MTKPPSRNHFKPNLGGNECLNVLRVLAGNFSYFSIWGGNHPAAVQCGKMGVFD